MNSDQFEPTDDQPEFLGDHFDTRPPLIEDKCDHRLVVIVPFCGYSKGDVITDCDQITEITASAHANKVHKIHKEGR